jgi:RimJ/RimL family protein N-acetyltransferase
MISPDQILETSKVILRPVTQNDFDAFLQLAQEKEMWQYFNTNLADPESLKKWMDLIFSEKAANTRRPFTITDKASGQVAGSMSLLNISYYDLRTEIGSSWLGNAFRSSGINKHAKYAMMNHVFEDHHFERVEFKTDVLNQRARKGLQNIGGIEEGVFRSHMTMWNHRRRSSIFYSVLKPEWPVLKQTIFKDIV